ncbi:glycerol-3-phosphate dehydrogenase/oxidase [Phycicoccus sp. CSK15P-2]|uniref:glycerol-3-phosphate dehydrogenase/oxidase n=1 Tax=Phycicoccus sp. CSK15P-2 TaxID=2807627 RepID=UPI00195188F3|nr:glycerol-3-phosphate dehydrogenase/oxidase [Phycicoccus sp. CSK15P-2]MBM6403021.1 glycerol-3-phosphate dehydrogenase/oxidase [Phycicoccus sp. CSK15P-2]
MTDHRPLSPEARREAWTALDGAEVDVLVVGGGVTGSGVALDAVTRGLRVALVEQSDLASGTSSRSSKLFHGGLRYLEQLDFPLVREALRERELMLTRLAPHLVKPVSFLYPLTHRVWERPYVTAGLTLYDRMGGARSVPGHEQLSRRRVRKLAPGLREDACIGALRYYDARADDARHTMTLARTAAAYGATVLTSVQVTGLERVGERVVGARLLDAETGAEGQVRTSVVVNATGVWTDDVQALAGSRGRFHVRASKGVHVVVPRHRIDAETGIILRTETSVLFVIPWGTHWVIGTTDTDWDLDKAHPAASRTDIDYILEHVNTVLVSPLTHDDIEGVYAGLRPLLAGESDSTSQLSREHAVARPQPGLVTIAGGKYTTYRVMAADAVDAAGADLPGTLPDSVTDRIPLLGAEGYPALVHRTVQIARDTGLPVWRIEHLLGRYGSLISELFDVAAGDPDLWAPLEGAPEYLRVEVLHAVTHEGALHLDDVLARRTRISIETRDRGTVCAPEVAAIVGPVLGWDEARARDEVGAYRARVDAERESQRATEDREANAERLVAPDIRRRAVERALS